MTEEEKNVTVDMPSDEEWREQQIDEIRQYLLDARENYPEPYYLLEYKGVPFSTLGGIQALSGQKKNGKTFLMAQMMAAILGTGIEKSRIGEYLPDLQVPERTIEHLGHLPTVLYVDTEMEKLNSAKVLRRVHWLCGWPTNIPAERFHVLWLRSVKKDEKESAHAKRLRIIKTAIDIYKPDAVFIDGIRDIIGDFNDNEESSELVLDLMATAEERGICIWNTLHMNPRPRNDDESKMRGHLGTELGNKVTDTLVCIKHKNKGSVWFTVKQDDARDKDMEDWEFIITEDAGSLGIPKMRNIPTPEEQANYELQQERIDADDHFKVYHWTSRGASWTDLDKFLRSTGVTSTSKIRKLFEVARDAGIIYKAANGKYHYNGLSNSIPNDESETLPFPSPDESESE